MSEKFQNKITKKGVEVFLTDVRLSFPYLYQPAPPYKNLQGSQSKYSAKLLLDKVENVDSIKRVQEAYEHLATVHKVDTKHLERTNLNGLLLKDGANSKHEEMHKYYYVSASSKRKPLVIDPQGKDIPEENSEDLVYGGAYVNAKLYVYYTDIHNGFPALLLGLQFNRHGEPFGSISISAEDFVLKSEDDKVDILDKSLKSLSGEDINKALGM